MGSLNINHSLITKYVLVSVLVILVVASMITGRNLIFDFCKETVSSIVIGFTESLNEMIDTCYAAGIKLGKYLRS